MTSAHQTPTPQPTAVPKWLAVPTETDRAPVWDTAVAPSGGRAPAMWLLGAHGGAGVSTLEAMWAPAASSRRGWPAADAASPHHTTRTTGEDMSKRTWDEVEQDLLDDVFYAHDAETVRGAADLAKAAWYVRDCIDHGSARMVMADRGFPRINPNVTHRAMALRLIAMGKVQEVARALDHFGSRVLDTREAATYEQEKTP